MSDRQDWMSDKQWSCALLLSDVFGGFNNCAHIKPFGHGIEMSTRQDLSTYDGSELTRLVLLAHKRSVRASVLPSGPGQIKIVLFQRKPIDEELSFKSVKRSNRVKWSKHPSIFDAINSHDPAPISTASEAITQRVRQYDERLASDLEAIARLRVFASHHGRDCRDSAYQASLFKILALAEGQHDQGKDEELQQELLSAIRLRERTKSP